MALCSCPLDQLCARCYDRELAAKRGQAEAIGQTWAERVCRGAYREINVWPEADARTLAIARRLISQLARDPRLLGELAVACSAGPAAWWNRRPRRYR